MLQVHYNEYNENNQAKAFENLFHKFEFLKFKSAYYSNMSCIYYNIL